MFAPWPKTLRKRAPQAFEIARLLYSSLLWYKTIVFRQPSASVADHLSPEESPHGDC
jgi:hypothetical protein